MAMNTITTNQANDMNCFLDLRRFCVDAEIYRDKECVQWQ